MKLTERDPRWLTLYQVRYGVSFRHPCKPDCDAVSWQAFLDAVRIRLNLDEIGTHERAKPHGRIGVLFTQKGAVYERTPKGTWHPPCLDISIVDPRPDAPA